MAQSYPTLIPGLRNPFDQVNGLVYFGRMLDEAAWQSRRDAACQRNCIRLTPLAGLQPTRIRLNLRGCPHGSSTFF
jgi:hypothetical protein